MPRYAARADDNQAALVKQIRAMGASVQHLHTVGRGCPDLLMGYQGKNYLLEVKDPGKVKSARKLTQDEAEWHERWAGQVAIVETLGDCLLLIGQRA